MSFKDDKLARHKLFAFLRKFVKTSARSNFETGTYNSTLCVEDIHLFLMFRKMKCIV